MQRGLFAAILSAVSMVGVAPAAGAAEPPPPLDVQGNRLVDDSGGEVRLLGVNRSGTEYACAQRFGFFDSRDPEDVDTPKMVGAIRSWGATAVRVPLNEHCWLGINGVPERFGGARYRDAITTYVRRLENQGLHPILDLHVVGAGDLSARAATDGQRPMADADHALDFWRSVGRRFGDDRSVVLDLFNEPYGVGWRCIRDGCQVRRDDYRPDFPDYRAVGMQDMVDAVRGVGAQNVLLVSGASYSNDLSRWLEFVPEDPLGRIAASFHNYEGPVLGACHLDCWEEEIAPIAERYPVVTAEMGDVSLSGRSCNHDYIGEYMPWADAHGISYLAWSWSATRFGTWSCGAGPALIYDFDGRPTPYGQGLRNHLHTLAGRD
jgi:endoglucanase